MLPFFCYHVDCNGSDIFLEGLTAYGYNNLLGCLILKPRHLTVILRHLFLSFAYPLRRRVISLECPRSLHGCG